MSVGHFFNGLSSPPLLLVNQIFRKAPNFSVWGFFYFVTFRKTSDFSDFLRKNRDLPIFPSRPVLLGDLFGKKEIDGFNVKNL